MLFAPFVLEFSECGAGGSVGGGDNQRYEYIVIINGMRGQNSEMSSSK